MYIQLSAETVQALKSLDRIPDSESEISRTMTNELLTLGLAYESRTGGVINMTAAGRLWLNQRAGTSYVWNELVLPGALSRS